MVKRFVVFLVTFLLVAYAFAGDTAQVRKYSRWYAGVSFTPGLSYRFLKENKITGGAYATDLISRNKYEIPQFAFNVGYRVGFKINRFLSVETGLEYSSLQYLNNNNTSYYQTDFNGLVTDSNTTYRIHARSRYHYLNIPLGLNFTFGKKKVQGIVSVGVALNYLISASENSYVYINNKTPQKSIPRDLYRSWLNLSPYFAIGFDYHINQLMILRVMPSVQIQAINNTDNLLQPISEHLYGAGINICLLFNLPRKK